jgi:CRP-like cAMP-binding protein
MKHRVDPGHDVPRPKDLPLFARSRATDPDTSKEAARDVEVSGAAGRQREVCLRALGMQDGATAAEVALLAGLERHAASRRLPELRDAGLVSCGDPRTCSATGRRCMTWWIR